MLSAPPTISRILSSLKTSYSSGSYGSSTNIPFERFHQAKKSTETLRKLSLELLQARWIWVAQGVDCGKHIWNMLPRSPPSLQSWNTLSPAAKSISYGQFAANCPQPRRAPLPMPCSLPRVTRIQWLFNLLGLGPFKLQSSWRVGKLGCLLWQHQSFHFPFASSHSLHSLTGVLTGECSQVNFLHADLLQIFLPGNLTCNSHP